MRALIEYLKALFFREVKNVIKVVEDDLRKELIRVLTNHRTILPAYKMGSTMVNKLEDKSIKTDKIMVHNGVIEVNPTYMKEKGITEAQARKIVDKLRRELDWDRKIR